MQTRRRFCPLVLIIFSLAIMSPVLSAAAQDDFVPESGVIVGTTGLHIRECPDTSCDSVGLAQLEDPVIVTGPDEKGFVPVQWAGHTGYAWNLYVETESRGTPFLESGVPGCKRLAVIFDIVYNHGATEGNRLWNYDGQDSDGGIYFEDGGDSTLSVRAGTVFKCSFGNQHDRHVVGQSKRRRLTGKAAADDESVEMSGDRRWFHGTNIAWGSAPHRSCREVLRRENRLD